MKSTTFHPFLFVTEIFSYMDILMKIHKMAIHNFTNCNTYNLITPLQILFLNALELFSGRGKNHLSFCG